MTRATRVAVALAAVLLAGLAASGAWLWWNYRPDRDQWIRVVHQATAIGLLVLAVALVVLAVLRRARAGAYGIVAAVGVLVTVGASYVLGRLIAWEGIGLHAVVQEVEGVDGALGSAVFVVTVRGRQIAPSTYEVWAYSHLVLGVLAALTLVMVWLRSGDRAVSRRPRPPGPASPAPAPEAEPA